MLRAEDIASEKVDIRLRVKLEHIAQQEPVEKHAELIAKLHNEYRHSIVLETATAPKNVQTPEYTCFNYAFELVDVNIVNVSYALELLNDGLFVSSLIAQRLEEIDPRESTDGDVVVYSDAREIMHAGKVFSGFVVSKWGHGGLLWKHRLFEIPSSYGDNVRFFRQLDRSVSEQVFLKYAKTRFAEDLIDQLLAS